METRKLGYAELHLSSLGLGTSAIGWAAYGWHPHDDGEFIATIRRALDLGVNWIDTAAVYGWGHAEEIVGQAIAGRRDEVTIATKCGLVWEGDRGQAYHWLKAESVQREAEASLRRLHVETIDLYQLHHPKPDEDVEEAWGVVADLIREGKVRYGGVSNFDVKQIVRAQAIHPVASLQSPYSILARGIEPVLLRFCAAHNIGVVAYATLQSGLLTDVFSRARVGRLPDEDWRKRSSPFQEPKLSVNLEFVEGLRSIAKRGGRTVAQLAVAWVLRRAEVTAAIVGARRPAQIEETVSAGRSVLSQEDMADIDVLLEDREQ